MSELDLKANLLDLETKADKSDTISKSDRINMYQLENPGCPTTINEMEYWIYWLNENYDYTQDKDKAEIDSNIIYFPPEKPWNDGLGDHYKLFIPMHPSPTTTCIVITDDEKYIISGSDDKKVRVWNILQKRLKIIFEGHTARVLSVAISNDRKYIVSGSEDKTIRIWNFLQKKQETILDFKQSRFSSE